MIGLLLNRLSGNFFRRPITVKVLDLELVTKLDNLLGFGVSVSLMLQFIKILFVLLLKIGCLLFLVHEQQLAQVWVFLSELLFADGVQGLDVLGDGHLLQFVLCCKNEVTFEYWMFS